MNKLSPTKQKIFNPRTKILGFDIETHTNKNLFLCASVYDGKKYYVFTTQTSLQNFFKSEFCKNSIIVATNLSFDFFGTFFGKDLANFNTLFRGSDLLHAKTYHSKKGFSKKPLGTKNKIDFVDTYNYGRISVAKMGKIIGIPKMKIYRTSKELKKVKIKHIIGKLPGNSAEWEALIEYNKRDSRISRDYLVFLYKTIEALGGTPKLTSASSSKRLFTDKYLKKTYYRPNIDVLDDTFKALYGGNVHAYKRGVIHNMNYYDFNSLYPSVMLNPYPDPNSLRTTTRNTNKYILGYEGVSQVSVYCPPMIHPLLPVKHNNKLLFPIGNIEGWYTHIELRKALELGYVITKVKKTHYYTQTCAPFKEFITDLYALRLKFKTENNPAEHIVKLMLNSLWGKFTQKYRGKDNLICEPTLEQLQKYDYVEPLSNGFFRVKKETAIPAPHCQPIWGCYTTAYGRLKLYDYIIKYDPVYVDTDSLITEHEIKNGKGLGELKLEAKIDSGIIVKPKFYMINDMRKVKGLGCRATRDVFNRILLGEEIHYNKFVKLRESLRRGFDVNEIIGVFKKFDLEDNKRLWVGTFDLNNINSSLPLHIENNLLYSYDKILTSDGFKFDNFEPILSRGELFKIEKERLKLIEVTQNMASKDFFDKKGDDISEVEFFENEILNEE